MAHRGCQSLSLRQHAAFRDACFEKSAGVVMIEIAVMPLVGSIALTLA